MLLPLVAAMCFASSKLASRYLASRGESPKSLTAYLLLFMVPISFIPAYFQWMVPSFEHIPWLVLMGLFTYGAHFAFSKAYALAEVTVLMPFGIAKFILSISIGYFAFSELPQTWQMWIGMGIIAIAVTTLSVQQKHPN
jgi:drug/metabolite transporter (DMT)-like permease